MSNIRSSEQFNRGKNGRGLITQGYDDHRKSKRQLDGNSFERDISSSDDGDDANQSNERTMMQPCENINRIDFVRMLKMEIKNSKLVTIL